MLITEIIERQKNIQESAAKTGSMEDVAHAGICFWLSELALQAAQLNHKIDLFLEKNR